MPPAKRKSTCRNSPLLDSLEQRLDLLTRTLSAADIAEKSIDIVKEIKELHAILRSLRDEASPEAPPQNGGCVGRPPKRRIRQTAHAENSAAIRLKQLTFP